MNDIQKEILKIYKEIKRLCEKNAIPFFAIGGTCIGAVRHKGFIPWDDDIDIAVPIEYYDLFVSKCNVELPTNYKFYDFRIASQYPFVFGKVINTSTTNIEKHELNRPSTYKGMYVDIMPIAGVPTNKEERKKYFNNIKRDIDLNQMRRGDLITSINPIKYKIKKAYAKMLKLVDINRYTDRLFKLYRQFPFEASKYTGYTWGWYNGRALSFPTSWFKEVIYMKFEDTVIPCPCKYDEYLRYQFGDYMKLPDEKDRISQHKPFIDLNRPFSYYQKHRDLIRFE